MSIYTYLKKDHDEFKKLMHQIEGIGAEDTEVRNELFNELKKKVILHSKAEEKAFYKPLRQFQKTREEVQHGQEEHQEAETLLQELTDSSLNGAAWMQKFRKFKEALEHHIEEEENEIFDDAKQVLDREIAREMEENMVDLKEEERQSRDIKKRVKAA